MSLIDQVRLAGVVGVGGGGFPAHVKLGSKAEIIIANGAECEPLLHKDAAVMEHYAAGVVRGVELCMAATGAQEGVIGIKAKKKKAVEAVEEACRGTRVRVQLLGDFYPAGDEYDLVYTVTGKLIPPGGLLVHVGAIVSNVETLVNIAQAVDGKPVTLKTITIAGAVAEPVSLTVPIGISFRECIAAAGGATCDDQIAHEKDARRAIRQPRSAPRGHRRNAHAESSPETKRGRPDGAAGESRRGGEGRSARFRARAECAWRNYPCAFCRESHRHCERSDHAEQGINSELPNLKPQLRMPALDAVTPAFKFQVWTFGVRLFV